MNFLKSAPIHLFLITPLVIFFLFVHNFNEVMFENTYRSLFFSLVFSVLFFFLFYFIFKRNKHKAGIFLTIICFFFWSYGAFYDLLDWLFSQLRWQPAHLHRYLLIFIALISAVLLLYFLNSHRTFYDFTFGMNIFIIVVYLINFIHLGYIVVANEFSDTYNKKSATVHPFERTGNSLNFPDIYYIILDGYANDKILEKFYNYKENALTGYLIKNKFFIADKSRANYATTPESLGSSLNYNYIDSIKSAGAYLNERLIFKNSVSGYLKSRGYRVVHLRSGYQVTEQNYDADTVIIADYISEFEYILLRYTFFRLDELMGNPHYRLLKNQMAKIKSLVELECPKFVFIHIVSPHPPFVCSPEGKYQPVGDLTVQSWEPKEGYIAQLEYVNNNMQEIISLILSRSVVKPIVIVQSDHGPWLQNDSYENIYEGRSLILNAVHIPYEWGDKFYSTITPVNTFRILFNGLFSDSLSILPDIPADFIVMQNSSE